MGKDMTASVIDFNSFMVRLKAVIEANDPTRSEFQFLYGAIKSFRHYFGKVFLLYFNSFMVRLKVSINSIPSVPLLFQFLYGAIKSELEK